MPQIVRLEPPGAAPKTPLLSGTSLQCLVSHRSHPRILATTGIRTADYELCTTRRGPRLRERRGLAAPSPGGDASPVKERDWIGPVRTLWDVYTSQLEESSVGE
jgi:hypothetical protein